MEPAISIAVIHQNAVRSMILAEMKPAKKSDLPGISWMEPMLPSDRIKASEDLAFDLIANANALAGQLHTIVTESVGGLVRPMNCYYSNLIEGHDTHPRDIDRALHKDYSAEPKQRALQLEAVAHVEVQRAIDKVMILQIFRLHRLCCLAASGVLPSSAR